MTYQKAIEIGGTEWKKGDHHRVYFNDGALEALYGLTVERYGSGSPKKVYKDGEKISNSKGWKLLMSKPYFDVITGEMVGMIII